ncbi:PLDc N-terminal domain-containing protein [Humidisolicoccus flavus]|uniref:PLD nuclease N-terminal domain-containing protein n=1 Tax=Humidisolicoccus flavus TaxID=3111414 RepID=UPI003253D28B
MRFVIIGIVLALVMMIYALVDLTTTDDRRIRKLNRILWVVLIPFVPVIGPLAWLTWGKLPRTQFRPEGPEDRTDFAPKKRADDEETDRRIRELEEQLKALDDEPLDPKAQKPGDEIVTAAEGEAAVHDDETQTNGDDTVPPVQPRDIDSSPTPGSESHRDSDDKPGAGG